MENKRNINIELIRVIAMLTVVANHYFRHGGGITWSEFGTMKYIVFWALDAFVFICVNLFVLISGYCLVQTRFKLSRLIRLWIETVTYSILCTLICKLLGANISNVQLIKAAIPFTTEAYWFVTAYAVLLCFTPFLNLLIHKMSQKEHQVLLIVLGVIFSIMPTFLVWERDLITTGMDYGWFIALYFFAAYIRKYGLNFKAKKAFWIYILCSLVTGLARLPLGIVSDKLVGSYVLSGLFFRYNSITVLVASICLFWGLLNVEIKNQKAARIILSLSPLTFAVYLIHDNGFVRDILWTTLPMQKLYDTGILAYLAGLFIIVPLIYLTCCAIEKVRSLIMQKLKLQVFLKKVDDVYADFLNKKLGIDKAN